MKICVTGSASYLARPLLPRLAHHPAIDSIVGIDLKPGHFSHPKFIHIQMDVRDPALARHLQGIDALIHLAFVIFPRVPGRRRLQRATVRQMNIDASRHVFEQARTLSISRLVHVSSAAVYGASAEFSPLTETTPLRPNRGFGYAGDKTAVEYLLDRFQTLSPSPVVTRLRPHVIIGPNAQPLLRLLLRLPWYPVLPDPQPLIQCVWEDDVATAIVAALFRQQHGTFNISAQPPISFKEMQMLGHRFCAPIPYLFARGIHAAFWQLAARAGEPAWLESMRHSLVVDTSKAQDELGWRAQFSTRECITQFFNHNVPKTP